MEVMHSGRFGCIWASTCFDLTPSFHLTALGLHREENAGNSSET